MEAATQETTGGNVNGAVKTFEPLPDSDYAVELEEVTDRKTKKGRAVFATFNIVAGEFEGRKLWHIFNYQNPSARCKEIGIEQLDRVITSLGGDGFEALNGNTGLIQDFVGKGTLAVRTAVKEAESYVNKEGVPCMSKAGNRITSFKAL